MSDPGLAPVVVGGAIGIGGAVVGAFINHLLSMRRDRVFREREADQERRAALVEGAAAATEAHNRARLPFSGRGALYFPGVESPSLKALEETWLLLLMASQVDRTSDALSRLEPVLDELRRDLESTA